MYQGKKFFYRFSPLYHLEPELAGRAMWNTLRHQFLKEDAINNTTFLAIDGSSDASAYWWPIRPDILDDYYWLPENCEHWIHGTLGTHTLVLCVPMTQCWSSFLQDWEVHNDVLINSTNISCGQGTSQMLCRVQRHLRHNTFIHKLLINFKVWSMPA